MKRLTLEQYDEILNYQLKFVGQTVDCMRDDPLWFYRYSITQDQYDKWKDWSVKYMVEKLNVSKNTAIDYFLIINRRHGLRISDDPKS